MQNRLYRDEQHKTIGGVCAGLATYFNVDISLIRGLFLLALIGHGAGFLAYVILWIVVPRKPFVAQPFGTFAEPQPDAQALTPVKSTPSSFSIISGIVLIMVGGLLLLDQYNIIPNFDFQTGWPLILIVVGLFLMVGQWQRKPAIQQPATFDTTQTDNTTTDSSPTI